MRYFISMSPRLRHRNESMTFEYYENEFDKFHFEHNITSLLTQYKK